MDSKCIYLDTNIVLDIVNNTRINNLQAIELWNKLIIEKWKIVISEDMLTTIFYINKDKKQTLEFFKTIQKRWLIVPFGKDVITNAIELSLKNNLDLEDVLQCLCAKKNECSILISNDNNFYNCGESIYSTKDFLDKFKK